MSESVFICFDYGSKKTGIAVGQTITHMAAPLETIRTYPRNALFQRIEQLIIDWKPTDFVVGIPMPEISPDNDPPIEQLIKKHPLIPQILQFARRLGNKYDLPVHLVDEHLSSHEAAEQLRHVTQKKSVDIDSMAAKIILETWIANPHSALNLRALESMLS